MDVRFWGVRGSVASSGAHLARIGGNTSCVEVESQGHRLILDAGTGLRALGEALVKAPPVKATLLFSHLHWDHVQGFPFFAPAYAPSSEFTLYGPGADGEQQLRSVLSSQMEPPHFPVPLSAMRSRLDFKSAVPGRVIETGPFRITPIDLPHPQGCVGYHIEADGQRFAYCTDVELTAAGLQRPVARVLEGVDALVLDAQYTTDEYEGRVGSPKKGWGHSTNWPPHRPPCPPHPQGRRGATGGVGCRPPVAPPAQAHRPASAGAGRVAPAVDVTDDSPVTPPVCPPPGIRLPLAPAALAGGPPLVLHFASSRTSRLVRSGSFPG